MTFSRRLTFRSEDLGKNADLVLTFDSGKIPGIYKDYHPSTWKVISFGATGSHYSHIKYNSQLAFSKAVVSKNDIIQPASTFVPINLEQKTKLTMDTGAYNFSDPVTDPTVLKTQIECENGTEYKEDIGLGFIRYPGALPDTALVWEGVGGSCALRVEFTPILRGYVITNFKQNAVLRGQINSPVLFEQNLAQLKEDTTWTLKFDHATGKFCITQA